MALAYYLPFSGDLTISSVVWDAYAGYIGKLEYYCFVPKWCGSAVVFRKHGVKDDRSVVKSRLCHDGQKWSFAFEKSYWKPPDRARSVSVSRVKWDLVSFTLFMFDIAARFGCYNTISNNCVTFAAKLLALMDSRDDESVQVPEESRIRKWRRGNYELITVINWLLKKKKKKFRVLIDHTGENPMEDNGQKGT